MIRECPQINPIIKWFKIICSKILIFLRKCIHLTHAHKHRQSYTYVVVTATSCPNYSGSSPDRMTTSDLFPVQNFCQVFLDTQRRCLFMCLQTGDSRYSLQCFPCSSSLPPPKDLCFGWDYKCSNPRCHVPMLPNAVLQGLKGCSSERRRKWWEKLARFTTLYHTSAPSNIANDQSHKVSWTQRLQPLFTCKLHSSFPPAHLHHHYPPLQKQAAAHVQCRVLYQETLFSPPPSLISIYLQKSRSLINTSPIYHTHFEWPRQDAETLRSSLRCFVVLPRKKCRASVFILVRTKDPVLLTSSKRESAFGCLSLHIIRG